tara:strand:+ start:706 stop:918 length:213 start_codon:yes stop_codon:yes gene_type:complete
MFGERRCHLRRGQEQRRRLGVQPCQCILPPFSHALAVVLAGFRPLVLPRKRKGEDTRMRDEVNRARADGW